MAEKEKKKDGRGGARKGAGRKPLGCKQYGFKASGEMARMLDSIEKKSEFIKQCIQAGLSARSIQEREEEELQSKIVEMEPVMMTEFDSRVAAGFPIDPGDTSQFEQINVSELLCKHTDACFIVKVLGESMIDAGINNGDYVIIDTTRREPMDNEVALCEINGFYTIKYFKKDGDGGWMYPANSDPKYQPMRVSSNDRFRILGTVSSYIGCPKKRNEI